MKRKYFLYVLLFVLLSGVWASCNQVTGVYVASHGIGTDTLKILSDQKYIRICCPPNDNHCYIDTGTWEISEGRIDFMNWNTRIVEIEHSSNDKDVIWGTFLDRPFYIGKMRLPINLDLDYYYIKQ